MKGCSGSLKHITKVVNTTLVLTTAALQCPFWGAAMQETPIAFNPQEGSWPQAGEMEQGNYRKTCGRPVAAALYQQPYQL